jgi:hypothetical protein
VSDRTDENAMTDARREALVHLQEECCEVAVAVAKALRHGLDSVNPDDGDAATNLEAIADELGDVQAAADILLFNLSQLRTDTLWFRARVLASRVRKLRTVEQYLHAAAVPPVSWVDPK